MNDLDARGRRIVNERNGYYEPSEKQKVALFNNFKYHAPRPEMNHTERYQAIRDAAKIFATVLVKTCPESRELSVAMTELETSVMWANAAIARNETE